MKLTFLGTGTSTGVPQIGCHCDTCTSTDARDRRLRTSAIVTTDSGANILIDCGPDFRAQILGVGSPALEGLLITHSHYDHTGGIDDLRPYCKGGRHFPTYCTADVARDLRARTPWSFAEHLYPGVPTFAITEVRPFEPFELGGTTILPLAVMHGQLPILGFRFGTKLAYITDCKTLPQATIEAIAGIDTLIINALRFEPHPTHLSLEEAMEVVEEIGAKRVYFTHMSHGIGRHADLRLPAGVELAHDGLTIEV
ncbi:MAG: MBL fold metallo-hydrolase [Muribaculaceae bacterium]